MAARILRRLKKEFPDLEIEELDIGAHPLRAWRDGIRFVPALRSGDKVISGLFLHEERIRKFIAER